MKVPLLDAETSSGEQVWGSGLGTQRGFTAGVGEPMDL